MQIVAARNEQVGDAAACLVAAFARDALIDHFFAASPLGRDVAALRFFTLLLQTRIALGMPALLAHDGTQAWGVAMGYDTTRPAWPAAQAQGWRELEAANPGLADRFDAYERISDGGLPPRPHHYLGVLGVHPQQHGTGLGATLLRAFCDRARADPASSGVYLETANPENLTFYRRGGFTTTHSGPLSADSTLWCLFHSMETR